MRFSLIYFAFVLFFSCKNEPQEIYSSLDGINYKKIMNGPINTEKYILTQIHEKDTCLKDEYFDMVINKLEDNNQVWRINAFYVLSLHCGNLDDNQERNLQSSLFNYFIHYPKEYMTQIGRLKMVNSDCFLGLFANYVQTYLNTKNITLISMKNVAYKYCIECSDEQVKSIYRYLELASHFQKE